MRKIYIFLKSSRELIPGYCVECGYEEEAPDFVVDEFFPTMICPECNGDLKYKKS